MVMPASSSPEPSRFKFKLGHFYATPGVIDAVAMDEILVALWRHGRGDWGDLDSEDKQTNDRALVEGARLLSAYQSAAGTKFWIITECDRSSTTVLLPNEY